jgi:hypothetical protein
MKIGSSYVPGSMYKKFYGTNMSRMNRQAVASAESAINSYGTSVFSTTVTQSQGMSEIVAKQYAARISAEAKEKMAGALDISSLLQGLGASSS